MKLVADTAKTLVETDFGDIETHSKVFGVALDRISGPTGLEVKMHQTAVDDAITTAEAAKRFGPLMKKGAGDRIYPIGPPFIHQHGSVPNRLTFIANKDCTVFGRVLQMVA